MLYAGIDEVGVSSVAGSMVASIVILPENHGIKELPIDSKRLSEEKIEKIAKEILEVAIICKTYKLSAEEVDKFGDFSVKKLWNRCANYILKEKKRRNIELDKIISKSTNKEREKSCGCIIIKDNKVLLIKQTKGHWGFPKGHVEKNETEIETAIREVKEETNLDVEIDANKRYTMEYVTDKGKLKQVVLFIAKCIGGEIKAQECEVNDIKWLDFDEAIETITYDNTRELFKKILKEENYERK